LKDVWERLPASVESEVAMHFGSVVYRRAAAAAADDDAADAEPER